MPTRRLPDRPDLQQLRVQARDLQRGVRSGDAEALRTAGLTDTDTAFPLHRAQLALARAYGFPSWPSLQSQLTQLAELAWSAPGSPATSGPTDSSTSPDSPGSPTSPDSPTSPEATDGTASDEAFLRTVCWLAGDGRAAPAAPGLAGSSFAVAVAVADVDAVRRHLAGGTSADAPIGPWRWPALMYLTYSRAAAPPDRVQATLTALLEAGADPDGGRFVDGRPTPFTVLTGVFGKGESSALAHPFALDVARRLLQAGADANDGQAVYDLMFEDDDTFLRLLFEFGLGTGEGGPWRRRVPDLADSPTAMLRGLLAWAVMHDQRERVRLLAAQGVDLRSPLVDAGALATSQTPLEVALASGHLELAEWLRAAGADEPAPDPADAFVAAVMSGDRQSLAAAPAAVIADVRRRRPGLIVWAVARGRADMVSPLVRLGWDVDALGRSDVPVEQPWQTALHTAVEMRDPDAVLGLLALGADRSICDARFAATPADWAAHFKYPEMMTLLAAKAEGEGTAGL